MWPFDPMDFKAPGTGIFKYEYCHSWFILPFTMGDLLQCTWGTKRNRQWQDSNLQSPDPKSGALSIRPHGLLCWSDLTNHTWLSFLSKHVAIVDEREKTTFHVKNKNAGIWERERNSSFPFKFFLSLRKTYNKSANYKITDCYKQKILILSKLG